MRSFDLIVATRTHLKKNLIYNMIIFKKIILGCITLAFLPFVIWNVTFGFVAGYILLALLTAGLYFSIKRNRLKPIFISLLVGFVLYLALMPVTMPQMNNKTAAWQERISNGGHLSFIEKWNVYGISITASVVAFPFFPEASKEFLYMMVPAKNGLRTFEGDFFMQSKKLQDAFKQSDKGKVVWYQKHYNIRNAESRVALALNACTYEIIRTEKETTYKAAVAVRYPKKCRSTMLKEPLEIRVEEGLFRYLEEEGWLFGYNAVWIYVEQHD